jgi:hypothetical protein
LDSVAGSAQRSIAGSIPSMVTTTAGPTITPMFKVYMFHTILRNQSVKFMESIVAINNNFKWGCLFFPRKLTNRSSNFSMLLGDGVVLLLLLLMMMMMMMTISTTMMIIAMIIAMMMVVMMMILTFISV